MKKKRFLPALLALIMLIQIAPLSVLAEEEKTSDEPTLSLAQAMPFTDVANQSWYYDYVQAAYDKQLFSGVGEGRFGPEETMTRAMFVTVLGRMEGINESDYPDSTFSDVKTGLWYSAYVKWASDNEIVMGYSNGKFGPDDPVTREQMAALIARYIKTYGYNSENTTDVTLPFNDTYTIQSWAVDDVKLAYVASIFVGDDENNFNPDNNATRAQAAKVFVMILDKLNASITHRPDADTVEYQVKFQGTNVDIQG